MIDYVPDRVMVKRIKDIDPLLTVKWHDHLQKWCIYRKIKELKNVGYYQGAHIYMAIESPAFIMRVENPDKSFRPLDNRTIIQLHEMDVWNRYRNVKEYLDKMDSDSEARRARIAKAARDDRIAQLKDIPKRNWDVIWDNMANGRFDVPEGKKHIYGVK